MREPRMICSRCGGEGRVKYRGRGSLALLLLLTCCLVVPGVLYLAWMISGDTYSCRRCKSHDVVDVSSRRGQRLVARFRPARLLAAEVQAAERATDS